MKQAPDQTGDQTKAADDRIAALVNEYFDRREAGEPLSSDDFLAEHPEAAEKLKPYLKGLALLDEIRSAAGGADLVRNLAGLHDSLPAVDGYEVLGEIARGGMGVVYKARQLATKRIVALKVMLAGPFASPKTHRRFEREVELAARLRHPRIVNVLESGQVATGQKYFAMDHVSGLHLDQYIAQQKPDRRAILALFIDLCEAVDYAHTMGVVHRDIKPANVLIDANGMPHIMDFGLAKATDSADLEDSITAEFSAPGQVLGTLKYLSPEQAAGAFEEVDVRTDVYALGVVLYEALTGAMPYDTLGRPSEVIKRIIETPPTKPASVTDHVDAEVSTILLKALEKDQARRYASAKEMGADIRRYLDGEPILAKRASTVYLLRKRLRRNRPQIIVATAAIALGVGGVVGGALWTERNVRLAHIRALSQGRHHILWIQRMLEKQQSDGELGFEAYLAPGRYPQLQEAPLVFARDRFERDEVEGAILFLNAELGRDPSRWPCRELLAEIYRNLEPED
ncbi:MAG: serine/threonine-protein kinase, partial [Phycisphaerae bacterium]